MIDDLVLRGLGMRPQTCQELAAALDRMVTYSQVYSALMHLSALGLVSAVVLGRERLWCLQENSSVNG